MRALKSFLSIAVLFLLTLPAAATSVRGTALGADGKPLLSGTLEFQLSTLDAGGARTNGCGLGGAPQVFNLGVMLDTKKTVRAGSGGAFIDTVIGNDQINCGAGYGVGVFWHVTAKKADSTTSWEKDYSVTGATWNVNTAVALNTLPPSPTGTYIVGNPTVNQVITQPGGTSLTIAGTFIATLSGNATTATALAANPTDCPSNQFAISIVANGNLTCNAVTDTYFSGTLGYTHGGLGMATAASTAVPLGTGTGWTTINAVSTNTATTLVERDSSGNFSAGTITAALNGNATTATTATTASSTTAISVTNDTTTNSTMYPVWATASSGTPAIKVSSSKLTFNPSTGALTATSFVGSLTGNASTATSATSATSATTASSLAADPADCVAGNVPQGVSATGVTQNCLPLPQTMANVANKWLNSYDATTGLFTQTQPAFSNLTGSVSAGQMPALTGDATSTAGTVATTVVKVNGVAFSASPSVHQIPVITASNTATYKTLPTCTDTSGNHLNFDTATDTWSCGTSTNSTGLVPTSRTISAGAGIATATLGDLSANRTVTWDPSTFVNNVTLWDAANATRTLTANLSGATDPVITFGNNSMDVTTGVLKYGGNTVATSANNLSFFSSTTSAQLATLLSDETGGAGVAVFASSPSITTPSFVTGFQIGAAAPSGHIVRGNATNYVDQADTSTACWTQGNDSATVVLADTDDEADFWTNDTLNTMRITRVWAQSDAGSPIVNLQRDDGTAADILTSNLTAATGNGACTDSSAASMAIHGTTITCTNAISATERDIAAGHSVSFKLVTAGGTAKRVTVCAQLQAQ